MKSELENLYQLLSWRHSIKQHHGKVVFTLTEPKYFKEIKK